MHDCLAGHAARVGHVDGGEEEAVGSDVDGARTALIARLARGVEKLRYGEAEVGVAASVERIVVCRVKWQQEEGVGVAGCGASP